MASDAKIITRSNHMEQYYINSQISSKSQILDEFHQQKTLFRVCGLMTKTLDLLELALYEGAGALALTHRNLDTLTAV